MKISKNVSAQTNSKAGNHPRTALKPPVLKPPSKDKFEGGGPKLAMPAFEPKKVTGLVMPPVVCRAGAAGAANANGALTGASAAVSESMMTKVEQERYMHAINQLTTYFELLDTAAGGKGGRDGRIGRGDLQAIVDNNYEVNMPQDLLDACRYLLENDDAFEKLSKSDGGEHKGVITREGLDMEGANLRGLGVEGSEQNPSSQANYLESLKNAVTQIYLQFESIAGKDGLSRGNLFNALKNPTLNDDERSAYLFLLANPAVFNLIEAAGGEKCNGTIDKAAIDQIAQNIAKGYYN